MKNILFSFLVLLCGVSSAAIFQVNLTVQDQIDGNPGDGVCAIPSGGFCTLRAAIMEANALPGSDIIVLPGNATIRLAITGSGENSAATGDLDITDAVAIGAFTESTADFPTVDANLLNDRVFHVLNSSGTVSFVNMGIISGAAGAGDGGAISISTNNQVNITRVWFEDNTADSGGAIFMNALSELLITDSVFVGNAAVSQGGAVTVLGPAEINQSTLFENLNFNNEFKEAVFVGRNDFGPDGLTLKNSTVFNNSNTGIYALAADVTVQNSTFSGHSDRGIGINPGGGITPDLRISNSVFDQNAFNCSAGAVNSLTNNWNTSSDNAFCFPSNPVGTSTINIEDPKLSSLKVDDENWHRYYRPGFYSPIVDSAHPAAPGPGLGCEAEDQRGVARTQDGDHDGSARCDRGAIELLEDVIFYDDFDIVY